MLSRADVLRHYPWRYPGSAPVQDACGMAGGGGVRTGAHGSGRVGPGAAFFTSYGMTECCGKISVSRLGRAQLAAAFGPRLGAALLGLV